MKFQKTLLVGAAAAAFALGAGSAGAAKMYGPGVTDSEIKIGHINPYSGPASAYGTIGKTIGAVIAIFCCGSLSPKMYPARTRNALLPARLKSSSTSISATM